jgi:Glycosyltransferase Family 4
MASRTVDLVALGPPPLDPYEPASTAWALAEAFAAKGDRVRVLYPEGPAGGKPPAGTTPVLVPLPLKRPGAAVEGADFASAAGRRVHPGADLVVRDPAGLGALGLPGRRAERAPIVAFVRSGELIRFDHERLTRSRPRWMDRLDAWRDRRSVRRLERAALTEADLLFSDAPDLARAIATEYQLPDQRLRAAVPPVPDLPAPDSRTAARTALGIPPDVLVVVAAASSERAEAAGIDKARETFRRVRPFFPGVRLVVVGASAPSDPGVVSVPARDPASFGLGLAAGNVALFAGGLPGFDPMVIGAMRLGCPVAAVPSVRLPADPDGAVRYSVSDDLGDLASVLAELLADPALCREVAARGQEHAAGYAPARIVEAIDRALPGTGR